MQVGRPAAAPEAWRSTVTGRVDVTHVQLHGERRALRTYLPPGYERSEGEHPLLVMFDGQNLFDRATTSYGMEWGLDETVEAMVGAGELPGLVIAGLDSPRDPMARYAEYTGWDWALGEQPVRGIGTSVADLVVSEVLPYLRRAYRVSADRAMVGLAGSSMGGAMTLLTGLRHPQAFGRLLAFSPVLLDAPMRGHVLRAQLRATGFAPHTWVYLDMGGAEQLGYVEHPDRLVAQLRALEEACAQCVAPPEQLVTRVIPGAAHDELAWGARAGEVLRWAFGGGPAPG
jgi:enterochelin esterase-like enzyme